MKFAAFATIIFFGFLLSACNQQTADNQQIQGQIDSLRHILDKTYKPGLGEFMSSIQVHHEKLWFAGINNSWPLADFEIHEIEENLDDIKTFCADRPEVKSIGMITQPLQQVNEAIHQKNSAAFKSNYLILTNTCNSCHQATQHGFNVIIVPTTHAFSNQKF